MRRSADTPHRVTGVEKSGGRTYTVVDYTGARQTDKLYFDAQTGLLRRRSTETRSPLGATPSDMIFEDYREVNGVKMPFLMTIVTTRDRVQYKFSEVQLDVPIDPAKFEPPPAAGAK